MSPIDRLAKAFKQKKGIRFTADEVQEFVIMDDAIDRLVQRINDEESDEEETNG